MNIITLTKNDLITMGTNSAGCYAVLIPSFFITQAVDRVAHKILGVKEGTKTSYCIKAASVITCTAAIMHFASPIVLVSLSIRKCAELLILGTAIKIAIKYLTDVDDSTSEYASTTNLHNDLNKEYQRTVGQLILNTVVTSIIGSPLALGVSAFGASVTGTVTDETVDETKENIKNLYGSKS